MMAMTTSNSTSVNPRPRRIRQTPAIDMIRSK
jgi:hypothetical protein